MPKLFQLKTIFLLLLSVVAAQPSNMGRIISACNTRFRVISVLGKGSFGTVYRAIQAGTGTIVAIKVVKTQNVDGKRMYRKERDAMEKIKGVPHTVPMICSKTRHGDPTSVIILEFCNEGDVESKLQKLTQDDGLKLWDQMAVGLKGMHERGIIHQDIKPANLFLHNGELKIGDFGIATTKEQAKMPGQKVIGTIVYMSPERIFRQKEPYSEAVDLWAAGITFYKIFAKKHPFYTETDNEGGQLQILLHLLRFAQTAKSVIERDLDPKVAPIVHRLLQTNPFSRSIILSNKVKNDAQRFSRLKFW